MHQLTDIDTSKLLLRVFPPVASLAAFMATTGNMPLFEGSECNTGISTHVNALIDIDGTLSFVHPESGESIDTAGRLLPVLIGLDIRKKKISALWLAASPLTLHGAITPPTLFLNSSVARMHAGRDDYINVLNEYNIYSEVHGLMMRHIHFLCSIPGLNLC